MLLMDVTSVALVEAATWLCKGPAAARTTSAVKISWALKPVEMGSVPSCQTRVWSSGWVKVKGLVWVTKLSALGRLSVKRVAVAATLPPLRRRSV